MGKARQITINLKSELTTEELTEVLDEMLCDSKYSYYFDEHEWDITEVYKEPDPEKKHWDDLATWNERFTD